LSCGPFIASESSLTSTSRSKIGSKNSVGVNQPRQPPHHHRVSGQQVARDYIEREYARYRYTDRPNVFQVIYRFCALIGRGQARQVFEALSTEGEGRWRRTTSIWKTCGIIMSDASLTIF
jgi:hypothetical protein